MIILTGSFIFAQLVYTGLAISYIIGILRYGVGRYASEVSEEDYVNGLKVFIIPVPSSASLP
jgi:hypothetical protein